MEKDDDSLEEATPRVSETEVSEEANLGDPAAAAGGGGGQDEGLLKVPGQDELDPSPKKPSSGRRKSLKDAATILKREALKQYQQDEGIEGEEDESMLAKTTDEMQQPSGEQTREANLQPSEPQVTAEAEVELTAPADAEASGAGEVSSDDVPGEELNKDATASDAVSTADANTVAAGVDATSVRGSDADVADLAADAATATSAAAATKSDDHTTARGRLKVPGAQGHTEDGEDAKHLDRQLTDDFFYDEPPAAQRPAMSDSVPSDLVQLYHSFGFEVTKRSNLQALDPQHVLFASGNVVEIFNVYTHEQQYIRSSTGRGIGAIAVHPSHKYFAVAEKGTYPPINIYEWPSLKLFRILREGTVAAYSHMSFSPMQPDSEGQMTGGHKLASVGSAPDYMLTVWEWKTESIILRYKAFSQEVYRVSFSADNEGQLTTSGTGHIRFWKMATTFTGLKLQGEIGRFGRTEISDICGYIELPDGKVVSGAEWGNMLLWDGGLIKVEISMKGKKSCHQGMIEEVFLEDGELITAAVDGYVRMWDFETIDNADFGEDNRVFEVEPIAEIKVGQDVKLKTLSKVCDPEMPTLWFAQDSAGALWKLDISALHTRKAPERMAAFHSGSINDVDLCPVATLACSVSSDGCVRVQDFTTKLPICSDRMLSGGSAVLWAPMTVDKSLTTLIVGCSDGVVRVLVMTQKSDAQCQWTSQKLGEHCEQVYERQRFSLPTTTKNLDVQLVLKEALKPHTKSVTAMVINGDGSLLATGSEDCTVFLFSRQNDSYKPIGYIEMPSGIASLQWKPSTLTTLLCCCVDGECKELTVPAELSAEAATTFSLQLPDVKSFTFTSIKQRLKKEEEEVRKAAEEEERRKKKAEESSDEDEDGEKEGDGGDEKKPAADTTAADGDKEGEEGKDEEDEGVVEEIDTSQGKVLFGRYADGSPDTFILSVGGFDSGYLYHCRFEAEEETEGTNEPFSASALPQIEENKDTAMTTGFFSGQYFFAGTTNGLLRVHETSVAEGDVFRLNFDTTWSLSMHDPAAAMKQLKLSPDGKYLLSVGTDSNFFVYRFGGDLSKLEKRIAEAAEAQRLKEEAEKAVLGTIDDISDVRDIDDPSAYSIEEAKQKAEQDRRVRLAEKKKLETRRGVELLRREFRALFARDEAMPDHMRLGKLDFQMDPLIQKEVEKTVQEKIETLHKECSWESERTELQLQKLHNRFKANVQTETTLLVAFSKETEVSTYRLVRPPAEVIALAESTCDTQTASVADLMGRNALKARTVTDGSLGEAGRSGEGPTASNSVQSLGVGSSMGSQTNSTGHSSATNMDKELFEAEQRKAARLARERRWAELEATKPDANYQDPDDKRMIHEAKTNMGDFKLKTAADFVVSEEQRVNADKKKRQLARIETLIYRYKEEFNQMLLELRDVKVQLVKRAEDSIRRIVQMQADLPESVCIALPSVPTMSDGEMPERKKEYTRESLYEFKSARAAREAAKKAAAAADGGGFGGFGGFGGGGGGDEGGDEDDSSEDKKEEDGDEREETAAASAEGATDQSEEAPPQVAGADEVDGHLVEDSEPVSAKEAVADLSELEAEEREEETMRIVEGRDTALRDLEDAYVVFDCDVQILRHKKLHLDNCIKQAEFKYITTYEEYLLLKDYETREKALTQRLETRVRENQEMSAKVMDVESRHSAKKRTLESWQNEEKEVHANFAEIIPESSKFFEYLQKVFKKKIKREVKKEAKDDGEEDSDDEEEEDSDEDYDSDSDEDEEEEDDNFDDTIAPPGMPPDLLPRVYKLREGRTDAEEKIAEEKKLLETLRKELETLKKKAKLTEGQVKSAMNDIDAFQREKQARINQLSTVVVVNLDQVKYGIYYACSQTPALQSDLSGSVLFPGDAVPRLARRIEELQQERIQLRHQQKENRVYHSKLLQEKRTMLKRVEELRSQLHKLMILKFGRLVDLDKLEMASINRNAEELKQKLDALREQQYREVNAMKRAISDEEERLTGVLAANTRRIAMIRELCAKERELGKRLEERARQEASGIRVADDGAESSRELDRLVALDNLQQAELDMLTKEIIALQQKGGVTHVPRLVLRQHQQQPHSKRLVVNK